VVTIDEVAGWAMALPGVTESTSYGNRSWNVGKQHFAWVRPFSKADIKRLAGAPVPSGPIVAVRADDLGDKEAILAAGTRGFFTIEHFASYPAYLVQLDVVAKRALREALLDGWLAVAPEVLARDYLDERRARRRRP
jgi:hypothetical protein